MVIPALALALVSLLIVTRRVGRAPVPIWLAMTGGAALVLVTVRLTPRAAIEAIDWRVLGFLAAVFLIGRALEETGLLAQLAAWLLCRAASTDVLVLALLLGSAAASALLMNDTLAIAGTPVALGLARAHGLPRGLLLLTLAFGVTVGSVPSPVGNPQNLLVAIDSGMPNPFVSFGQQLLLPTLVSLALVYVVLRVAYWRHFRPLTPRGEQPPLTGPALARLARVALAVFAGLIVARVVVVAAGSNWPLSLPATAGIAAAPLLLHRRRVALVRGIDWRTLVFFVAMFIVTASVAEAGIPQRVMNALGWDPTTLATILMLAVVLSQVVSNVPLVVLYLPLLHAAGADRDAYLALAAGATMAGNLSILGAASNVIVIQSAERRREATLSFLEFARVGVLATALPVAATWALLRYL